MPIKDLIEIENKNIEKHNKKRNKDIEKQQKKGTRIYKNITKQRNRKNKWKGLKKEEIT